MTRSWWFRSILKVVILGHDFLHFGPTAESALHHFSFLKVKWKEISRGSNSLCGGHIRMKTEWNFWLSGRQCMRDSTPTGKSSFPWIVHPTVPFQSNFSLWIQIWRQSFRAVWMHNQKLEVLNFPAHVADHETFSWSMFGDIHWTDCNELWRKTYPQFNLLSAMGDTRKGLENFWEKSMFSIFRLQARSTSDFGLEISPLPWEIWPWN